MKYQRTSLFSFTLYRLPLAIYRHLALSLFCLALVVSSARAQGYAGAPPAAGGRVADDAVSFRLKGVDGRTYDLDSMRGNVLLVSFGATWCSPCRAELRALEELKREYRDKPVRFLWVSIEGDDEISDKALRAYAEQQKLSFPVLRDAGKLTYAQFSQRVRIPLVVFFDKSGRVALPLRFGMATPELYKSHMRERLDKLLGTQSAAVSGRVQHQTVQR